MVFASWILTPIGALTAILYPFGQDEAVSRTARASRWLLHLVLWSGLLALLWHWEQSLHIERWLRSSIPVAHRYYLVIVALAVYSLGWLCRGLWNALRVNDSPEADDDLADAWVDALATIELAGICTATTPTFLVLGTPSPTMETVLGQWGLRGTSPRTNLPFHVFVNHDAIVVASDRLSVLASLKSRTGRFQAEIDGDERANSPNQLGRLCRLIASRCDQPAVQGVLIVLPLEATNSDLSTRGTIDACQADLATVRASLGLDLPTFIAIIGTKNSTGESMSGVAAFQPFPPNPDLDPADIPSMWRDGIDRLCLETLPIQRLTPSNADARDADRRAAYDLVGELHLRRGRWTKLLAEGTRNFDGEAGMVGGLCVISTTAEVAKVTDASKALWAEMLEFAPAATWTPQAIADAEKAALHERRRFGWGFIVVVAALALSVWLLLDRA